MDYQGLPPSDVYMMCEPDVAVPLLLEAVRSRPAVVHAKRENQTRTDNAVSIPALAQVFNELTEHMDVCLSKLPLGWNGAYRHFRHPMDYLGADGGGGVGAGPGLTVGAALALKDTKRMVVGIMGDGDFLMGVTAVWTATHYKRAMPDAHREQSLVLQRRASPGARGEASAAGRWRTSGSGSASTSPTSISPLMARAQGAVGIGPVTQLNELRFRRKASHRPRQSRQGVRGRRARAAGLRNQHEWSRLGREALRPTPSTFW